MTVIDRKPWLVPLALLAAVAGNRVHGADTPLFAADEPLELTLVADFKHALSCRGWSVDRWHGGTLELTGDDGQQRTLEVRLKVRQGFRTRDANCHFPQLFVDFSSSDSGGTPFAGQRIVPLDTHCRATAAYARYVHRAYIAYRLYNLLSPRSLGARAAQITYVRSDKPVEVATRPAFFVEHFDDLARRFDAQRVELDVFHPLDADPFEMGVLELFEFMIGNTDWSAAFQHNILLTRRPDRKISAVPYDFDFSGLVNAEYASHHPRFEAVSVRTRVYRGWCRGEEDLQRVLRHFREKRPEVFAMLAELDWMPKPVVADARRYLRSFYDVLDSPRELDRMVRGTCATGMPRRLH